MGIYKNKSCAPAYFVAGPLTWAEEKFFIFRFTINFIINDNSKIVKPQSPDPHIGASPCEPPKDEPL